jgi:hypothetical protein
MATARTYREVGEAAWSWVLGEVRGDDGPWLPDVVHEDAPAREPARDRDSLYAGIAGLAPVLAEIQQYRTLTGAEEALAAGIVARLSTQAASRVEASLYDGLAGDATALRLLAPGAERVALRRLEELKTDGGWQSTLDIDPELDGGPLSDLVTGTAGVVLAAAWAGGDHAAAIMTTGGEALLRAAESTRHGLDWRMKPGFRSSTPNYSHGTAGVAAALAIAGRALERPDFIVAATQGGRHLLDVGWLQDGGFVIPHTLPYSQRDVEPVTYTWCHGPAGTSLLFAALARVGVQQVGGYGVGELRRRCLRSVLSSGVPERLRPGFWDNDGRCCGTAGVGDVLLDAAQDAAGPGADEARPGGADPGGAGPGGAERLLRAARTMGDALVERAIRDDVASGVGPAGARWRFIEHRLDPPLLPPGTSWMQGAAGIAAFLLRLARVDEEGLSAPVVDRPDQWWAVPAALRTAAGVT